MHITHTERCHREATVAPLVHGSARLISQDRWPRLAHSPFRLNTTMVPERAQG
jgi:hypothetical protein